MKKLFAAVLATAMMFTMAGCKSLYQLDPASKTEQELDQVFRLTDPEHRTYRCIYCETKAN